MLYSGVGKLGRKLKGDSLGYPASDLLGVAEVGAWVSDDFCPGGYQLIGQKSFGWELIFASNSISPELTS